MTEGPDVLPEPERNLMQVFRMKMDSKRKEHDGWEGEVFHKCAGARTKSPHVETTTEHLKSQFKFLRSAPPPWVRQTCGNGLCETYTFPRSRASRSTNKQASEKVAHWKFPSVKCWQTSLISGGHGGINSPPRFRFMRLSAVWTSAHSSSVALDIKEMRTDVSHLQAGRKSPGCWNKSWQGEFPSLTLKMWCVWKCVLVPSGLTLFYDVAAVWLTLRKRLLVPLPVCSVLSSLKKEKESLDFINA